MKFGVKAENIYRDFTSGSRLALPQLKACLSHIKAGDTLIVARIDRLGRSLPHLISIIIDITSKGICFYSIRENLGTREPDEAGFISTIKILHDYERTLSRESIAAGLAAAKHREKGGGRPPSLSSEKIKKIIEALGRGESKASICREFDVPRSTLIGTLSRIGWKPE